MTQKFQLAVPENPEVHGPGAPRVTVLATGTGVVTTFDKIKGYYKGLVAAVGAIVVIANEMTPVFDFLPGQDKHYITVGVAVLTTLSTFLVANEHWVDDA
jgi:low affinity Fe/Cu permease